MIDVDISDNVHMIEEWKYNYLYDMIGYVSATKTIDAVGFLSISIAG